MTRHSIHVNWRSVGLSEEFVQALRIAVKGMIPVQLMYVTAKEVGSDTMVAIDDDNLEYFDIRLGIGSSKERPAPGARCLVGIIENAPQAMYLVAADQLQEAVIRSSEHGGIPKVAELTARLNEHENKLNALIDYISALPVPVSGAVSGPPVPAPYAAFKVALTQRSQIENTFVKHG